VGSQLSSDLASLRIQRDEGPPSRGPLRVLIALVVVGAIGGGGAVAYARLAPQVWKTQVATTEVALLSPAQSAITVTATGYVVPQVLARPGAKLPGRLARVRVKEGDVVKAGQVIAELDAADQQAAVASADARAAAAFARADAARVNILELKQQLKREKALAESGVTGRAVSDDLEARELALDATARAATVEAQAAKAEVESLRVLLRDRTILAPVDGTVVTKPPEAGEIVGPGAPLVEIADFASMLVETEVPEARLHLIKVGAPCEIVLDAYPSRRYRGTAVEIGRRVNRAKASVIVKVGFVDTKEGVLPDMAARVSFLEKEASAESMKEPPKLVVSAGAVTDRGGAKVVFVVDQGKVRMVQVALGAPVGPGFELGGPDGKGREAALATLPPGTKLVDKPPPELADGYRVKDKEGD
jgi:HlyD family secretion protein